MTIKLLIHEGLAKVDTFSLPAELYEGDPVIGYVDVVNIGLGVDLIMCRLVTEWNGASYETQATLNAGATLRANVPAGVVMPAQDAVITMRAFHDEDGVWILDDTVTH